MKHGIGEEHNKNVLGKSRLTCHKNNVLGPGTLAPDRDHVHREICHVIYANWVPTVIPFVTYFSINSIVKYFRMNSNAKFISINSIVKHFSINSFKYFSINYYVKFFSINSIV
jgi:hypothetical protein